MHVALVTHCFPSPEHPYIGDWVRALVREGIRITVIAECSSGGDGSGPSTDALAGLRILELNSLSNPAKAVLRNAGSSVRYITRPGVVANAWRALAHDQTGPRRVLRQAFEYWPLLGERYDVVHFNAAQIAIRRLELGCLFGAPVIVSFRGQDFTLHPDRYDRLLREADHLHFISRHLLEEARKRGYRGDRHSLIPPLVDTEFYRPPLDPRPSTEPPGPFKLFTAARMVWTKGWEFALEAVALLRRRGFDVTYYAAGDGELRPAIAFTVRQLGLEDRVRLLGWLTPEQVRSHLWDSDLYLLPSVEEAFNNSVLQAQACGVPVVCSDAGGLPENVVDGETGLIARRRDARDLAGKIAYLLERPQERARMSERARARIVAHFDLKVLLPAFVSMYERVAGCRTSCRAKTAAVEALR